MDCFISYDGLPIKSGGAHRINSKSLENNYNDISKYLDKFTDARLPESIQLKLYFGSLIKHNWFSQFLRMILKFGIPSYRHDGYANILTWNLKTWSISKAIKYITLYSTQIDSQISPVSLDLLWHFRFKDLTTNQTFEGQNEIPTIDFRQHNSELYLRLGLKSSVSAWFTLPFSNLDEKEIYYIKQMEAHLPFKFSKKSWRKWEKSKNNSWFPRRVEIY